MRSQHPIRPRALLSTRSQGKRAKRHVFVSMRDPCTVLVPLIIQLPQSCLAIRNPVLIEHAYPCIRVCSLLFENSCHLFIEVLQGTHTLNLRFHSIDLLVKLVFSLTDLLSSRTAEMCQKNL
jgi:hypothetical protein